MSQLQSIVEKHKFVSFDSRAELEIQLAHTIAMQLKNAIAQHGRASLAVSGGSTPKALFKLLSETDIQWSNVDLSLVDERWVDSESTDSNERLLRTCFARANAIDVNIIGMKSAAPSIEQGVTDYQQRLTSIKQPFDVLILGMGNDGHTASWFPDATETVNALSADCQQSVAATNPISQSTQRITLTFPTVAEANNLYVHITGEEKKQVLFNGIEDQPLLPIHQTLKQLSKTAQIFWSA